MQVFSVAPIFLCFARRQRKSATTWASFDFGSLQKFWRSSNAIVQRTREATRSSAFAGQLRAGDSPRPLAFFSNLCHLSSRLVQDEPKLQPKIQALSVTAVLVRRSIEYFEALLAEDISQREFFRCFRLASGPRCQKQQAKP